jgi:hypothetical protein
LLYTEYGAAESRAEAASLRLRHTSKRRFKNNYQKTEIFREHSEAEIKAA